MVFYAQSTIAVISGQKKKKKKKKERKKKKEEKKSLHPILPWELDQKIQANMSSPRYMLVAQAVCCYYPRRAIIVTTR